MMNINHRRIGRNAIWNWAGTATGMISGFVVAPYLIAELGEETYALWILIASLTGYFNLLDLGVRGSVGRNLAFTKAQDDRSGMNSIINTAALVLGGVALLALLALSGVQALFFQIFDVPPAQAETTRIALIIIGVNLAVTFPCSLFDAILWASQRFDMLNWIEIPTVLLRIALTFGVVAFGYDLIALSIVTLFMTLSNAAGKAFLAYRIDPGLRIGVRYMQLDAARSLYGYGVWYFMLSGVRVLTPQIGSLIIGSQAAIALVTPYSIATRLIGFASSLLIGATQVLTPVTTSLHATSQHDRLREVFVKGGMYCASLTVFCLGAALVLGESFIALWVGHDLEQPAGAVLSAVALGELLPMSQWVTYSALLGMGRHRFWACMSVVELFVATGLGLTLVSRFGIVGVAIGFAIPAAICRGALQVAFGCRTMQVSVGTYLREAMLPAALVAVCPVVALAVCVAYHQPGSWPVFVLYSALYCAIFLIGCIMTPAYAPLLRSSTDTVLRILGLAGLLRFKEIR